MSCLGDDRDRWGRGGVSGGGAGSPALHSPNWNTNQFYAHLNIDRVKISVGDPNPCVFGPPPGSFCHQAKTVRKNLDSYCFATSFWLFKAEKLRNFFFWRLEGQWRKQQDPDPRIRGPGSVPRYQGSATLVNKRIPGRYLLGFMNRNKRSLRRSLDILHFERPHILTILNFIR